MIWRRSYWDSGLWRKPTWPGSYLIRKTSGRSAIITGLYYWEGHRQPWPNTRPTGGNVKRGRAGEQTPLSTFLLAHARVGKIEPLLNEVDAQHCAQPLQRATSLCTGLGIVRLNERHQSRPRNNARHLVEKYLSPRYLRFPHKSAIAQAHLLHLVTPAFRMLLG